jgi:O-antigen/teichoic acid export membrane protein
MTLLISNLFRSKTVRTITVFGMGNMVAMLLGLIGTIIQARYISPSDLGVFRTFGVVAGYLAFLQLGVFDGLQREIPLQMGRGNQTAAEQAASACLAWIMVVSAGCVALFLGWAIHFACYSQWMQFWGCLSYTPAILVTLYGGYLGMTFRTGQQFVTLSKTSVIQALAGILVLPLLPVMGYYGICLRASVISLTNLFLLHRWRPLKVRPRQDWPVFWRVIRVGLPLSGIGYVYTSLWISVEGTIVLTWFGTQALGLYAVSVFIRTVVSQLVLNVSQVLNVKMCEHYGRSSSAEHTMRRIVMPVVLMSLGSLPLIAVGWLLLPWVVRGLIPRYVEATVLMQIFLLMMPIALLKIPTGILWVSVRLLACLMSVLIGFGTFLATAFLAYRMGFGSPGVAAAFIVGQVAYLLAAWFFTLRVIVQERRNVVKTEEPRLGAQAGNADVLTVEQE